MFNTVIHPIGIWFNHFLVGIGMEALYGDLGVERAMASPHASTSNKKFWKPKK
jgi:hypothetical protein